MDEAGIEPEAEEEKEEAEEEAEAETEMEALRSATRAALATTEAILAATDAYCATLPAGECPGTDDEADAVDPERRVRRMRARELRIVQGQDVIRAPPAGNDVVRWTGFWGGGVN